VLGPQPELDDLVQDAFLEALRSIDGLENPAALRAWLGSIAAITARGWLRKRARKRWLVFLPTDEMPESEAAQVSPEVSEALRATYRVLDRLPTDERVTFALRFVSGLDIAEVAASTNVSLSTAKRRVAASTARFRRLAAHEPALTDWLTGEAP
jgi:RNA polymerase sigma-70 factor (ECF subfamily)